MVLVWSQYSNLCIYIYYSNQCIYNVHVLPYIIRTLGQGPSGRRISSVLLLIPHALPSEAAVNHTPESFIINREFCICTLLPIQNNTDGLRGKTHLLSGDGGCVQSLQSVSDLVQMQWSIAVL